MRLNWRKAYKDRQMGLGIGNPERPIQIELSQLNAEND
jgi:hypothetical protein